MTAPAVLDISLRRSLDEILRSVPGAPCDECQAESGIHCDTAGLHWVRCKAARQAELIRRDEFARLMTVAPGSFEAWAVVPWPGSEQS